MLELIGMLLFGKLISEIKDEPKINYWGPPMEA